MEFPVSINVKSVNVGNDTFMYDGDTGFLTKSTGLLNDVLDYISCSTREEIVDALREKYGEEEIIGCLQNIETLYNQKKLFDREKKAVMRSPEAYQKDWEAGNLLVNLWLNVSHDCNLRCIYCFGHGGSYGGTRELMSIDTAKKSIDYWFKYLNKNIPMTTVTFFGGEPLMNLEVIKFSINYVNKLLEEYDIRVQYIITTNGTIFNDEIIELFMKNDVQFAISIDGGQAIQDRNRPLERQVYSEPDTLLRRRFKATCSMSGLIEEATLGIFMYETIGSEKNLLEYIGEKIERFCDIFSLPAQLSIYSDSKIENEIMSFLSESDFFSKPCGYLKNLELLDKREGFVIPLPNQNIAIGANYKRLGYADTGLVVLFSYLINVEYFRKRLRFETGAYSSFMRHYADGTLLFESINDPGLEVFIERIKELPAFLNSLMIRQEDIDSLKREAVKKYLKDFVLNNPCDNKTIKYLKNVSWSHIEKQINTIMVATKKDFEYFANQIECVINQNCLCVLGNERILKRKEDIFSIMGRLPIDLV